jgi:hypothetical protein
MADNAYKCDDCGDYHDETATVSSDDITVCRNCFNDHYCWCSGCDVIISQDDSYYCEQCEESRCGDCACNHDSADYRNWRHEPLVGDKEKAEYIKDDRLVGIEIEAVNGEHGGLGDALDGAIGISDDGSLHGNTVVEIQTPPASSSELERMISNACSSLRKYDWEVNSSCGLHVHIDAQDIRNNEKLLRRLFLTYGAIEDVIYAMLPESRRTNTYCKKLDSVVDENELSGMINKVNSKEHHMVQKKWYGGDYDPNYQSHDKYDSSRYHGLNVHSLLAQGHVEMRYHHGTISADAIRKWIKFHLEVINWITSTNFSSKALRMIHKTKSMDLKKGIMFHRMKLSEDTRRYVKDCIKRNN